MTNPVVNLNDYNPDWALQIGVKNLDEVDTFVKPLSKIEYE